MYIDVRTGWFENDRSRARIISYGRGYGPIPNTERRNGTKKRRQEEEGEKGKMRKCGSWKKRARVKCPRWLATILWQKDKNKERFGRILLRSIALFYTRIGIQRCACARSCAQQVGAGALVASRPDNLKAIRSSLAAARLTRKIFKNWSLPSYLHYISRFVKQDVDEGLRYFPPPPP